MARYAAVLIAVLGLAALACAEDTYVLSSGNRDLIFDVNSNPKSTWVAGVNEAFANHSLEEIKGLLGAQLDKDPEDVEVMSYPPTGDLPTEFDSRKQWPDFIHPIRNQLKCGSCWAFGAAESFSDRLSIATKGKVNTVLSPQDLVSCAGFPNQGCNGGIPFWAHFYLWHTGITTDECFPYTSGEGVAPKCAKTCADGSAKKTHKYKKFFKVGGMLKGNPVDIQKEIMTNGPVEAAFTVYADFMNYKTGVYQHTTGNVLGGHAIKLVGWGVEDGTDYWLVANSWGTTFGLDGYFKIKRGTNESGIERTVYGGLPAESA